MWLQIDPLADKYPGWSPYNYVMGNPLKYIDPDGRFVGNYYDVEGNKIGNDGKDDGEVYIVKEGEEETVRDYLSFNSLGAQSAANTYSIKSCTYRLPHSNVRKGMIDIYDKMVDNNKDGTKIRELGGTIWLTNDGGQRIVEAEPGGEYKPGATEVSIITTSIASGQNLNGVGPEMGRFHTHPQNTPTISFGQPPSQGDLNNATDNMSLGYYVVSDYVYRYNSQGTQVKVSRDNFKKMK